MPYYKKIAVFGATSGIGKAIAIRAIEDGSFVIVIGRRKENLAELVQQYGHERVQACPFDITQLESIPNFVTNITSTHSDLDAVFLNSGIQRSIDFAKPDEVDMQQIQEEFTTNYLSQLALTKAFLSSLLKTEHETSLIYTTSGLALVPMTRCPNYCASKAAMHSFILTLREQLKATKVKVVELYPPAVQTELHDKKHQPQIEDGNKIGMPLDDFLEEAWAGLTAGKDQVPVGGAKQAFEKFENAKQEVFADRVKQMAGK